MANSMRSNPPQRADATAWSAAGPIDRTSRAPLRASVASAACVLALLGACSPSAPAQPKEPVTHANLPPGTVMVLNDVPIRAEEIDTVAGWFARFEPQNSLTQCRRLALTNTIFPRIAAQGLDPARRERARQQALEYERAIRDGTLAPGPIAGPMEFEREGSAKQIGLDAWAATVDAQPLVWSSVHETPGSFEIVRLKERGHEASALWVRLKVGVLEFPYIDEVGGFQQISAALDASKLVILDPAWKDDVPIVWQQRLHVDSP